MDRIGASLFNCFNQRVVFTQSLCRSMTEDFHFLRISTIHCCTSTAIRCIATEKRPTRATNPVSSARWSGWEADRRPREETETLHSPKQQKKKSVTLRPIRGLSARPGRPVITLRDTSCSNTPMWNPTQTAIVLKVLYSRTSTSPLRRCFQTEAQNQMRKIKKSRQIQSHPLIASGSQVGPLCDITERHRGRNWIWLHGYSQSPLNAPLSLFLTDCQLLDHLLPSSSSIWTDKNPPLSSTGTRRPAAFQ